MSQCKMINIEATSALAAISLMLFVVGARCERIMRQDANFLANEKMDAMIHRLDQLERSVSTLRAQCSCQTQKFLDAESNRGFRPVKLMPSCTSQILNICEREGPSEIDLDGKQIKVLCGSDRWIVALQRFDGSTIFHNKNWDAFKRGIGTVGIKTEFFLGLQSLSDLSTEKNMELRFEMEDFDGGKKVAHYSDFSVSNERDFFRLGELGSFLGDAGDSFSYHQGQGFTTLDRDNDGKAIGSCGEEFSSAGWFKSCMEANLFGRYLNGENTNFKEGMYWETFRGPEYSLKSLKMFIRFKC